MFRKDDIYKKTAVLSGGEKSRLNLIKFLVDPPNLLLMDEPTTHLDIPSTDALLDALKQFQGTLIFISHDVYFIRELANHVVHVKSGLLKHYPGGYPYYLDKTAATSARAGLTAGDHTPVAKPVLTERPGAVHDDSAAPFAARRGDHAHAAERCARSDDRDGQEQRVHDEHDA